MTNCIHCGREAPTGYAACGVCAHRSLEEIYPLRAMPMKHQYDWQVGQQLMCALCGKMDYHEGPEECPGTGAGTACAYYDGVGYVFIDGSNKVVEQSEVNSPRTWTFLKNGREYDGAARVDEILIQELERHLDKICAERDELMTENARLKARIRELEPEQPQPRPLYRWGRPV